MTVAKISIGGELFEFDGGSKPMSEALAIEEAYGKPFLMFEQDLQEGSAKALATFAWLVLRRNGRHVEFADIVSGKFDFDFSDFLGSLQFGDDEKAPDPTPPGPSSDPDSSPHGDLGGTATTS